MDNVDLGQEIARLTNKIRYPSHNQLVIENLYKVAAMLILRRESNDVKPPMTLTTRQRRAVELLNRTMTS